MGHDHQKYSHLSGITDKGAVVLTLKQEEEETFLSLWESPDAILLKNSASHISHQIFLSRGSDGPRRLIRVKWARVSMEGRPENEHIVLDVVFGVSWVGYRRLIGVVLPDGTISHLIPYPDSQVGEKS